MQYDLDDAINGDNMLYYEPSAAAQLITQALLTPSMREQKLRKNQELANDGLDALDTQIVAITLDQITSTAANHTVHEVNQVRSAVSFKLTSSLDVLQVYVERELITQGVKKPKTLPAIRGILKLEKPSQLANIDADFLTSQMMRLFNQVSATELDSMIGNCLPETNIVYLENAKKRIMRGQLCAEEKGFKVIRSNRGVLTMLDKNLLVP